MRWIVLATVMAVGAVFAPTATAQAPTQDSVTGGGGGGVESFDRFEFQIDAHSGPSGEAPTGTAALTAEFGTLQGPVTCLAVKGNVATLNFVGQGGLLGGPQLITFTVTDSPAGDRLVKAFDVRAPADCSPLSFFADLITFGDVTIADAQPPATYTQCRQAGWVGYGFASHAACINYVHDLARKRCSFERAAHGITTFRAKYGFPPDQNHAMRHCVRLYTGF